MKSGTVSRSIFRLGIAVPVLVLATWFPLNRTGRDAGDPTGPEAAGRLAGLVDPEIREAGPETPAPTEIVEQEANEEEQHREREAWIEEMHRAPDVDWREIESENRRAQSLERFARIEDGRLTNHWTEVGSANLAGRTMSAAPDYHGGVVVGSNLGGAWHGNLDGTGWTPISDGLGLGPHQVLVVPEGEPGVEPEVILMLASIPSYGTIHATTDGGATWFVPDGMPTDLFVSTRLVRSVAEPRTVYFLCQGREYDGTWHIGYFLLRSTDGGLTFEIRHMFPVNPKCDVWIDRINGGRVYVASGATIQISDDGGLNFQTVGTIPASGVSDVILSGSEAGAPSLYAAVNINGQWDLYRSIDAGVNWQYRYTPSIWWRTFDVSITDANVVYFGDIHCNRSGNGGLSFTPLNDWTEYYGDPEHKLHADLPGINIYWLDGQEAIFINTDGGTYVSYDHGATVENLSLWGLGISQYYDVLTSSTDPYRIAAGAQDQGFQLSINDGGGDHYLPFEQIISGDYGHLTSHTRDHNWLYSVYPGFILLQMNENPPYNLIMLDFPATDHLWLPPILADPFDPQILYFCGDHIWKYTRVGDTPVHNTTELPFAFDSAVTGLAISETDRNMWYATTTGGYLWYSHDGGQTWTETVHGPYNHYFYGNTLVVSPSDPNTAYAGGSGYQGQPVWKTTDGGANWTGISNGLPNTLVYELALGGPDQDVLYAATEAGPFGLNNQTGEWENLSGTEAPLTTYWNVEWVPEIQTVRFGTYGRGIWDYLPEVPTDVVDSQNGATVGRSLEVFPNPARSDVSVRFRLSQAGPVAVQLFDVTGRQVERLADRRFEAGTHEISASLLGRGLSTGAYFVRLNGPDGPAVRKLQILEP